MALQNRRQDHIQEKGETQKITAATDKSLTTASHDTSNIPPSKGANKTHRTGAAPREDQTGRRKRTLTQEANSVRSQPTRGKSSKSGSQPERRRLESKNTTTRHIQCEAQGGQPERIQTHKTPVRERHKRYKREQQVQIG